MKTGKIIKRALAVALAVVLILPVTGGAQAQAKSVITISTDRVQLTKAGETATVTINGLTAKQKKKVRLDSSDISAYRDDKNCVKLTQKGNKFTLKALEDGRGSFTASIGKKSFTVNFDVTITDDKNYISLHNYACDNFNDDDDTPAVIAIDTASGTAVYAYPYNTSVYLIYVRQTTDDITVVANPVVKDKPSVGIGVLYANGIAGLTLKSAMADYKGNTSDAEKLMDDLKKQLGIGDDTYSGLADIDASKIRASGIMNNINLSVATTVDFDSSSYVKGQQLKGFMGFFSDVDKASSASLSAYVEPALEAENAALSSKLGIGLKDLGYSGF